MTAFVLFFQGRSGSTFLIECLQDHPEILAAKEYLATLKKWGASGSDQLEWVEEYLTQELEPPRTAVGFKTKPKDVLDPEGLREVLASLEARLLLLVRRNRIKRLVSLFNSMRLEESTGRWNLYDESDRLPPFRIDPDQFDQWLEAQETELEEVRAYVESFPLETREICYEDLLTGRDHVLEGVFSFLGVSHHQVSANTLKNTSDDLREVLENFEELRARYVGTRYEAMFDEVLVG